MQKQFLYVILLLLVCSSCKHETDPAPEAPTQTDTTVTTPTCRLVKVIQGTHNGAGKDTTFIFSYDTTGKITKINYQISGYSTNMDVFLNYDNSGHLLKQATSFRGVSFQYTSAGLLSAISTKSFDSIQLSFVYGASTIPDKGLYCTYDYSTQKWDTIEHRYTVQNDNITSVEILKAGVSKDIYNYEYDTLLNNNKTLALLSQYALVNIGWFDEINCFNKNLIKRKTPKSDQPYYLRYQTESGRLTKSEFSWLTGTDTTQRDTRYFYYDCK